MVFSGGCCVVSLEKTKKAAEAEKSEKINLQDLVGPELLLVPFRDTV